MLIQNVKLHVRSSGDLLKKKINNRIQYYGEFNIFFKEFNLFHSAYSVCSAFIDSVYECIGRKRNDSRI